MKLYQEHFNLCVFVISIFHADTQFMERIWNAKSSANAAFQIEKSSTEM